MFTNTHPENYDTLEAQSDFYLDCFGQSELEEAIPDELVQIDNVMPPDVVNISANCAVGAVSDENGCHCLNPLKIGVQQRLGNPCQEPQIQLEENFPSETDCSQFRDFPSLPTEELKTSFQPKPRAALRTDEICESQILASLLLRFSSLRQNHPIEKRQRFLSNASLDRTMEIKHQRKEPETFKNESFSSDESLPCIEVPDSSEDEILIEEISAIGKRKREVSRVSTDEVSEICERTDITKRKRLKSTGGSLQANDASETFLRVFSRCNFDAVTSPSESCPNSLVDDDPPAIRRSTRLSGNAERVMAHSLLASDTSTRMRHSSRKISGPTASRLPSPKNNGFSLSSRRASPRNNGAGLASSRQASPRNNGYVLASRRTGPVYSGCVVATANKRHRSSGSSDDGAAPAPVTTLLHTSRNFIDCGAETEHVFESRVMEVVSDYCPDGHKLDVLTSIFNNKDLTASVRCNTCCMWFVLKL